MKEINLNRSTPSCVRVHQVNLSAIIHRNGQLKSWSEAGASEAWHRSGVFRRNADPEAESNSSSLLSFHSEPASGHLRSNGTLSMLFHSLHDRTRPRLAPKESSSLSIFEARERKFTFKQVQSRHKMKNFHTRACRRGNDRETAFSPLSPAMGTCRVFDMIDFLC